MLIVIVVVVLVMMIHIGTIVFYLLEFFTTFTCLPAVFTVFRNRIAEPVFGHVYTPFTFFVMIVVRSYRERRAD